MVDQAETPVNAGEQITNAPSSLPLKPDDQFRLINQRLENLAGEMSRVAKPPQIRLADVLTIIGVIIGIGVAAVGAFGLSERISDLRADQAATERRVTEAVSAAENRITAKQDKQGDQLSAIADRLSHLEGQQGANSK